MDPSRANKKGFEIKFICVEKTDWPDQGIAILKVKTQGANSLEKIGLDFLMQLSRAVYNEMVLSLMS